MNDVCNAPRIIAFAFDKIYWFNAEFCKAINERNLLKFLLRGG